MLVKGATGHQRHWQCSIPWLRMSRDRYFVRGHLQGPISKYKRPFQPGMGFPLQRYDGLFIMRIPIMVRLHIYIKSGPGSLTYCLEANACNYYFCWAIPNNGNCSRFYPPLHHNAAFSGVVHKNIADKLDEWYGFEFDGFMPPGRSGHGKVLYSILCINIILSNIPVTSIRN